MKPRPHAPPLVVDLAELARSGGILMLAGGSVALGLVHDGRATLSHVLKALTASPARILGLNGGTLAKGAPADLLLLDETEPCVLDARELHSRAHNTAFDGRKFQGRARMTFVGGECVFDAR